MKNSTIIEFTCTKSKKVLFVITKKKNQKVKKTIKTNKKVHKTSLAFGVSSQNNSNFKFPKLVCKVTDILFLKMLWIFFLKRKKNKKNCSCFFPFLFNKINYCEFFLSYKVFSIDLGCELRDTLPQPAGSKKIILD